MALSFHCPPTTELLPQRDSLVSHWIKRYGGLLSGILASVLTRAKEDTRLKRSQTKICVVLKIGHCEMCLVTENTSLTQRTRVHQDHPGSNNDFSLLWHWYSKTVLHILILVVFTNLSPQVPVSGSCKMQLLEQEQQHLPWANHFIPFSNLVLRLLSCIRTDEISKSWVLSLPCCLCPQTWTQEPGNAWQDGPLTCTASRNHQKRSWGEQRDRL